MRNGYANCLTCMKKNKVKTKDGGRTPRQRLFTKEFKKGQEVSVIRHRHGWEDGRVTGRITFLSDSGCTVTDDDGGTYDIRHPRDIRGLR